MQLWLWGWTPHSGIVLYSDSWKRARKGSTTYHKGVQPVWCLSVTLAPLPAVQQATWLFCLFQSNFRRIALPVVSIVSAHQKMYCFTSDSAWTGDWNDSRLQLSRESPQPKSCWYRWNCYHTITGNWGGKGLLEDPNNSYPQSIQLHLWAS